jgi:putative molybdopterin biosynthesis protein
MSRQDQFLDVIDRDEAEARFRAALDLKPLGIETIPLEEALGRVLARDAVARVDVPSFDRSNFDGFAVRAADTFGASELAPRRLKLLPKSIDAGDKPDFEVGQEEAAAIATGGMVPRGADAILMVEHADTRGDEVFVQKAVAPGFGIAFAGGDVSTGEVVLRIDTLLTSRETGVLAAIGESRVEVWRRPRVAIISTGNELIAPGERMTPPQVYDSNARIIADAVRELGGEPLVLGIVRDDADLLRRALRSALSEADVVLLSGGTSKGQGDLCYRVVAELIDPGIVAHGVALKPGKPICLAVSGGKPVVVLPGFPTSAIFTFHEFVAPVIGLLAGRRAATAVRPEWPGYLAGSSWSGEIIDATMAVKVNSEIGRTEYLLVGLVRAESGLVAYPMGKGSGSVTAFSRADGFVTIGRHTEIVEAGSTVQVRPLGRGVQAADLVVIGSHCVGLDYLLSELQRRGFKSKLIAVGSSAGLEAAKRGECDLAGIHLMDPNTGEYNRPFLTDRATLVEGYGRRQGLVFRRGDERFAGRSLDEIVATATGDAGCLMVNRNQGSGTRILIDKLLGGAKPAGYAHQVSNHNAVAAAVAQGRADWGMAIESVAEANGLGFLHVQDEQYDFVVPRSRLERPAVRAFLELLREEASRGRLGAMGFTVRESGGLLGA